MIQYPPPAPAPGGGGPLGGVGQAARSAVLQRLHRLKTGIVVATLLGFGALSGLVTGHHVGTGASSPQPAATTPSQAPAATPAPPADSGGFFDQGGGGGQGGQGGYAFGSGGGQAPVAGSGAS